MNRIYTLCSVLLALAVIISGTSCHKSSGTKPAPSGPSEIVTISDYQKSNGTATPVTYNYSLSYNSDGSLHAKSVSVNGKLQDSVVYGYFTGEIIQYTYSSPSTFGAVTSRDTFLLNSNGDIAYDVTNEDSFFYSGDEIDRIYENQQNVYYMWSGSNVTAFKNQYTYDTVFLTYYPDKTYGVGDAFYIEDLLKYGKTFFHNKNVLATEWGNDDPTLITSYNYTYDSYGRIISCTASNTSGYYDQLKYTYNN